MTYDKMPNVDEIPNAYSLLEVWGNCAKLNKLPSPSEFTDWK